MFELLRSAHARLDRELARILDFLNRGEAAAAAPCVREFGAILRQHIRAEDEILAPYFAAVRAAAVDDPVTVMLREHRDILAQLKLVEDALDAQAGDPGEAGIYAALLSGTLAKHEHREENNLFPRWRAALNSRSPAERAELTARLTAALAV